MSKTKALTSKTLAVVKSPPIAAAEPKAVKCKPPLLPTNVHWEIFAQLERDADRVLEGWKRYCDRHKKLADPHQYFTEMLIYDALNDCMQAREFFDEACLPFVEDREFTKKTAISARLGLLVDYFPAGKPPEPAVYLRTMAEHVHDASPTPYAIESASREAERTCKFSPVLAEFLPILKKHHALWEDRWDAVHNIGRVKRDREKAATKKIERGDGDA